jgi:hypothetical protein
VGSNKKYRKQAQAEQRVINEHAEKIALELEKDVPDVRLIHKWQKDIEVHQRRLEILLTRLPKRRK